MRRVLCAIVACGGLALSGCMAFTDDATQVTQTSARLNAHGHTDDSPAHYYFRYANEGDDLPTAAAKRTPRRDVPAHVGSPGHDVAFHEDVTGLLPGRVYIFEVCGGDNPQAPDWCGGRAQFFTRPSSSQDTVKGSISSERDSTWVFPPIYRIDAASGPQGQNADGFVDVTSKNNLLFFGRVRCLAVVNGFRATVGVVGTAYFGWPDVETPREPRPFSLLFTVTAAPFTNPTLAWREQSPPNCQGASFANQAEAFGNLLITDPS